MNNLLNNPLNNSIENERTLGGDQQFFAVRWDKVCPGKPRSFLFRDIKKLIAKDKGVLGTVEAPAPAVEVQKRKTLHSHWQCWTKEFSQELRD